jgi:hypothetical protein
MTSAEVRPVRAWAEYDEWSVYWQHLAKIESAWFIPSGADGLAYNLGHIPLETMIEGQQLHGYSLRSLRVLLSTGHEVGLDRYADSVTIPQGNRAVMLDAGCMKFSLFASDGHWLHGGWYMPEVADADAVARALSEAIAWVQGQGQEG